MREAGRGQPRAARLGDFDDGPDQPGTGRVRPRRRPFRRRRRAAAAVPRPADARPRAPDTAAVARTVQLDLGRLPAHRQSGRRQRDRGLPPGGRPDAPVRHTADRARWSANAPPRRPYRRGRPRPQLPLLERQEERERLVRLLARGRSVRLTGPAGSGRTSPPGRRRRRLRGPRARTASSGSPATAAPPPTCSTTSSPPSTAPRCTGPDREGSARSLARHRRRRRPGRPGVRRRRARRTAGRHPRVRLPLRRHPRRARAVRRRAPRGGLPRRARPRRLDRAAGARWWTRALTDDEANWAGDLWFESEGLPLRFVQAGALLRQRDDSAPPAGARSTATTTTRPTPPSRRAEPAGASRCPPSARAPRPPPCSPPG